MALPRKSSSATRDRLLRAAERCFTEHGFEGSSLRQITRLAGVNLAAVNYHFASKRELWLEMMQRRLEPLNAERVRLIEEVRATTPAGKPISLERICEAMVLPVAKAFEEGKGCNLTAARMVGRAINVPPALSKELNRRCLEQYWRVFNAALRDALPGVSAAELEWKFYFLMSAMLGSLAWHGRQHGLEKELSNSNLEPMLRRLTVFLAGGLRAGSPAAKSKP